MKKALPENAKIAKDAKETVQEYIYFNNKSIKVCF